MRHDLRGRRRADAVEKVFTAFGARPRRLANFGFLKLILVLPSNSLLKEISSAPLRLDRSLLSITIDNFPAFSRVCDQQTAAEVAQMKDQMVAVDQAANIGIQFQGSRPSGPAFIIYSLHLDLSRVLQGTPR
jgi:hypothetical protein